MAQVLAFVGQVRDSVLWRVRAAYTLIVLGVLASVLWGLLIVGVVGSWAIQFLTWDLVSGTSGLN